MPRIPRSELICAALLAALIGGCESDDSAACRACCSSAEEPASCEVHVRSCYDETDDELEARACVEGLARAIRRTEPEASECLASCR